MKHKLQANSVQRHPAGLRRCYPIICQLHCAFLNSNGSCQLQNSALGALASGTACPGPPWHPCQLHQWTTQMYPCPEELQLCHRLFLLRSRACTKLTHSPKPWGDNAADPHPQTWARARTLGLVHLQLLQKDLQPEPRFYVHPGEAPPASPHRG